MSAVSGLSRDYVIVNRYRMQVYSTVIEESFIINGRQISFKLSVMGYRYITALIQDPGTLPSIYTHKARLYDSPSETF